MSLYHSGTSICQQLQGWLGYHHIEKSVSLPLAFFFFFLEEGSVLGAKGQMDPPGLGALEASIPAPVGWSQAPDGATLRSVGSDR